jgi:xanthosine utilization system XapX-like protein
MTDRPMHWLKRLAGGVVGAGGAYAVLQISTWAPPMAVAIAIAALLGLAGLYFGPRIIEALVNLF